MLARDVVPVAVTNIDQAITFHARQADFTLDGDYHLAAALRVVPPAPSVVARRSRSNGETIPPLVPLTAFGCRRGLGAPACPPATTASPGDQPEDPPNLPDRKALPGTGERDHRRGWW